MQIMAYDPYFKPYAGFEAVEGKTWPEGIEAADFIVVTCALTDSSRHMVNVDTLAKAKKGVRVVNVARGPIIDEKSLIEALQSGHVHSAALDVFEEEPLSLNSPLHDFPRCIFGSHNASNTSDAVVRTSKIAIEKLFGFLGVA